MMPPPTTPQEGDGLTLRPRPRVLSAPGTRLVVLGVGVAAAAAVFLANCWANPPGFFWDESAIAYNAWRIASTGADMNGERWPVYTTFFNGTLNMPFVYLMSLVFAATGPSIVVARLVAGLLGLAAGFVIGVIAARISGRWWVGALGAAAALSSPWLFENSRLVFEVAIFPLAVALLLLATQRAARHAVWSTGDVVAIAAALALVTYGYTVGRLLGPMLAAALVVFVTRLRWQSVVGVWVLYGLLMLPAAIFAVERPGGLTDRFAELGYLSRAPTIGDAVAAFADHYLRILNPVQLLLTGDPNQRHHVAGVMGSVPLVVALLAISGIVWIAQRRLSQPWWRWLLIGLVVSPIPAALTDDSFHSLRLSPFFTFLTVVACYGTAVVVSRARRSTSWRLAAVALLLVGVVQATYFVVRFHEVGSGRGAWLDAGFGTLFANAAARGETIHVVDGRVPTRLHALWYATLTGLPEGRLALVADPGTLQPGALVLSGEETCDRCEVLAQDGFYTVYLRSE
jgi:hypothetical protein